MNQKSLTMGIFAAAAVVFALWAFVISPAIDKSGAYQGEIVEKKIKKRLRDWSKTNPTFVKRYLVIKTDRGDKKKVRVPPNIYITFKVGERVVKKKGERYPRLESGEKRTMSLKELKDVLKKTKAGSP